MNARPMPPLWRLTLYLALFAALFVTGLVQARSQTYDLSWATVDGGGYTFSSGGSSYRLGGTTGQADAGLLTGVDASGGTYGLDGGFWPGGAAQAPQLRYRVYLPLVSR